MAEETNHDSAGAGYEVAYERLKTQLSLERTAQEKIEVSWDDLLGMATPISKQIPIQVPFHPNMVYLHPDASITVGLRSGAFALGVAGGAEPRFPDMRRTVRHLHKGYLPVIDTKWQDEKLKFKQTALCYLPNDEKVLTGKERQCLLIRLVVENTGNESSKSDLMVTIGSPGEMMSAVQHDFFMEPGNDHNLLGLKYGPSHLSFTASPERWRRDSGGFELLESAILKSDRFILSYKTDESANVRFESASATLPADEQSVMCENALVFTTTLQPGASQTLDLVVTDSGSLIPADEAEKMRGINFDQALIETEKRLNGILGTGMKLQTPESRLNDMYKSLILSCFGCIAQDPNRPWKQPYQTPFLPEILPWEQAFMLVPMMSLGFYQEVEPCLRFFVDRQAGVGSHAVDQGPVGAKSFIGSYPGQASGEWMNNTGSTLWMLAAYYQYTNDGKWLKEISPSINAAWKWIQQEREGTRILKEDGEKVEFYGLMPSGRAGDWGEGSYIFTFNDNYTWYGMSEIAKAFENAGIPDAKNLLSEADEYKNCILDVLRNEEGMDPETGLHYVPNAVFWKKGHRPSWWMADGPVQLYYTGLLKPGDIRFEPMVEYTARKHGILLGMHETYGHPEWYNAQTDHTYHMCYLARGEHEKALLTFYSSLVYGMSHDCYQTQERTNVYDPFFGNSTYHPNGSNIGRHLAMLRRTVIDEQHADEGRLWLLRGCPSRWFEEGETIVFEDAPTLFGKMALRTKSDGKSVVVDIVPPTADSLKEMVLSVRHPEGKAPDSVTVDGKSASFEGEQVVLQPAKAPMKVVFEFGSRLVSPSPS
ncbi:hypothetical protein ACFSR7_26765 [Cohnella sp. GCM10020058]|uniref:hypothetical protein n=1 Tax=Cohnella sp. GCM10020058 TaxID=3317330 RepID=UPI0036253309